LGGRHEEFSRSPASSGSGSGRCYPGHPTSECGDADLARLFGRYLLAVPGFFFPFALPLIFDANGQALAHVCFEDEQDRRTAMKWLTRDEARRTAANIARIPAFRRVGLHLKLPPKNQLNFSASLCVAVVRALVI